MRRILLIEDDRGMARGLQFNLRAEGYSVEHAADGVAGVERAKSERFDLILLDLMLPLQSGFEVLKALRKSGDLTPVILMSARDAEADRVEGLRLGADDFMPKPFGLGELLARIRARTRTARKVSVLDGALAAGNLDALIDRALTLTGADRGLVLLRRADGKLAVRAARARDGEAIKLRFSTSIVQRVLDSGRTEAMLDAGDAADWNGESVVDLRLRQAVCTPIRIGKRTLGVFYADSRASAQGFGREDLELVETLAAQCAQLIERARLKRVQKEKRRMEAELTEAKVVQQAMLPRVPMRGASVEIAGFNRPCDEAGGDYFDYLALSGDRVALVIGDVAGHGLSAALFMAAARSLLRTFLPRLDDSFMSLFLGEVNLRTGELRYASAGHAPGVVYRARSGAFDELKPTGPALGIVENAVYEVCAVVPPLQGEDALLLYTDGATEAMGEQRELYGLGRLKQRLAAVHGRRAPDIVDALTRSITTYADGKLDDDVSFLVVKANGQRLPVRPPIPEADAATA
jgi:serine phosphatase RsbU (regulator of sigma subunit)/DNA-binding response OmpR family regulator